MTGSAASRAGAGARKPRRGDVLDVRVERVEHDGRATGTAQLGDERYTVRLGGLPGALVRAEVRSRRRSRIDARVLEELEPSPLAVPARCPHVGTCGGCSFQELDYAAQLAALGRFVGDAFAAHGLAPAVLPTLGMPEPWHYRNKMEFGFSNRRWREAPVADDDQGRLRADLDRLDG
jgi:23S rRNA (uracil1939-C5)-methyltransferase